MTLRRNYIIPAFIAVLLVANHAKAEGWSIDKAHSRIGFTVVHLGINTVYGAFKKYDAVLNVDENGKLSSVTAKVEVASIDTGIDARDDHLRAPDLFDVKKFPKMLLVADKIKWKDNSFSGTAKLTIKNKTANVSYSGKMSGVKSVTMNGKTSHRVAYQVKATINRKQFGLTFGGFSEGLSMVSESVTIVLDVALTKPGP